jgi:hypothetical protein
MRRGRRDALAHVAAEFRARRIGEVAGTHQARVGGEPTNQVVERLVAFYRRGERRAGGRRARQVGELALVGLLERHAVGIDPVEVAFDLGRIDPGIEIGEIPFRQGGRLGTPRRGGGLPGLSGGGRTIDHGGRLTISGGLGFGIGTGRRQAPWRHRRCGEAKAGPRIVSRP